ncbi:plasmid-partitioning protein SopA [Raoultella terrigena]|uniref:Plasmid-partitioning protein SopA n=1 Tax=Raoultella terrigena TaxID=577 RepID=A0A4U9DCC0_RAOTE|nr:plasmid-partitioning protein SopA [Raoultella terrigena]
MGLMDTLNQCISAGHEMTKAIAIAQFNDDSPEARKITRRWRIGEAADLVGRVISGYQGCRESWPAAAP